MCTVLRVAVVSIVALAGCEPVATAPVAGSANPAGASAGASRAAAIPGPAEPGERPTAADPKLIARALEARDQRIRELDQALVDANEQRAAEIAALRGEGKAAAARIAELERAVAELRADLDRARRTVDALRTASPVANLAYDVPKIDGRVLSTGLDPSGARVVLLDAGQRQGVETGFEFTISQRGKAIAKVAVSQVEAEYATGRVVYLKDGETIREGDAAATRP